MEEFYTIQGEGYHTGTAAYFIRLVVAMLAAIGVMSKEKLECRITSSYSCVIIQNASICRDSCSDWWRTLMWDMTTNTES
jgi:hypothetical protein